MKNKQCIGIYPGSFDPITNGHLDLINRAKRLCDKLIVAVAKNVSKSSLFTIDERLDLLRGCCNNDENIILVSFDGLLSEYCKSEGISVIFRGLRTVADFEYETAIALMNSKLAPDVETVFLATAQENSFVSSKIVKEVASFGGDVSSLIPHNVIPALTSKFLK